MSDVPGRGSPRSRVERPLMSAERRRVLEDGNGAVRELPELTWPELFEAQVAGLRRPLP